MNNLLDTFIENGVYSLKNSEEDNLFITEAIGNKTIGKLVMYENVSLGIYYKTNTQYFINDYDNDWCNLLDDWINDCVFNGYFAKISKEKIK